ncbi:hypothetical protein [Adlercreutzia sp. ZJ473]|uniref:hypothetical protein n=1 Tax=Adlercreutzia sp. ZJ473 TaxID=2722822 RepID=UPI0015539741|nr:hypothetical protein [Adlercreutzia sp. ZJ473]
MLDSDAIKRALARGEEGVLNSVRYAIDERTARECETAFQKGLEVGIENSVRSMIAISAKDDAMVTVLHDVWGFSRIEAVDRIVWVKRRIAVEGLDEVLASKGKSPREIEDFHRAYAVRSRLAHENALFVLWSEPDQLYRKLVEMGEPKR